MPKPLKNSPSAAVNRAAESAREKSIATVKEMATALGRSEDYVTFMKHGGFRLPATLSDAEAFIREKGPPTRFRLYGHRPRPSCKNKA